MVVIIFAVLAHELLQIFIDDLNCLRLDEDLQPLLLDILVGLTEVGYDCELVKVAIVVVKLEDIFDIELLFAGNPTDTEHLAVNLLANRQSLQELERNGCQFADA